MPVGDSDARQQKDLMRKKEEKKSKQQNKSYKLRTNSICSRSWLIIEVGREKCCVMVGKCDECKGVDRT
jgi:hypothetical protein